jgi:hypothetical protein
MLLHAAGVCLFFFFNPRARFHFMGVQFVYLSVNHLMVILGCFRFVKIMNKTTITTYLQVLFWVDMF